MRIRSLGKDTQSLSWAFDGRIQLQQGPTHGRCVPPQAERGSFAGRSVVAAARDLSTAFQPLRQTPQAYELCDTRAAGLVLFRSHAGNSGRITLDGQGRGYRTGDSGTGLDSHSGLRP